jgi:hypothetical protein
MLFHENEGWEQPASMLPFWCVPFVEMAESPKREMLFMVASL